MIKLIICRNQRQGIDYLKKNFAELSRHQVRFITSLELLKGFRDTEAIVLNDNDAPDGMMEGMRIYCRLYGISMEEVDL